MSPAAPGYGGAASPFAFQQPGYAGYPGGVQPVNGYPPAPGGVPYPNMGGMVPYPGIPPLPPPTETQNGQSWGGLALTAGIHFLDL